MKDKPQIPITFLRSVYAAVENEFQAGLVFSDSATRGRKEVAFSRQVAMYLLNKIWRYKAAAIGPAIKRDRTTAHHGIQAVKDAMDDNPTTARRINGVEKILRETLDV